MAIFFDIDGTLLDDAAAERTAALAFRDQHRSLFTSLDDAFVHLWRTLAATQWLRYERGELSFTDQRRARMIGLFATAGRVLSPMEADELFLVYLQHYEQNWSLFPDVLPCLDALASLPLGIISNGDQAQQLAKLETVGIRSRFATVIVSGAIGVAKPSPAIFREACRRMSCPPHHCVYVGDSLATDALASAAAGLRGVWLHRAPDGDPREGVIMIRSLREMVEIVHRTA